MALTERDFVDFLDSVDKRDAIKYIVIPQKTLEKLYEIAHRKDSIGQAARDILRIEDNG